MFAREIVVLLVGVLVAGCGGVESAAVPDAAPAIDAAVMPVDLAVTRTGDGTGRVASAPAGIDCGAACDAMFPLGSTVELTASPDPGMSFQGWSGACSGLASCRLTMDGPRSVVASFRRDCTAPPTVVNAAGPSTVTVPANCRAASLKVWGGGGGGSPAASTGGGGGFATAIVDATPGERLAVVVGSGGGPSPTTFGGGGGGGASAVARGATPLVVAGGGGGGGSLADGSGGGGGGLVAQAGGQTGVTATAGGGGTQAMPGAGGAPTLGGTSGTAGTGGTGGAGGTGGTEVGGGGGGGAGWGQGGAGGRFASTSGGSGGGGGGGHFGGGGGGGTPSAARGGAGGGGGSSFVDAIGNRQQATSAGDRRMPGGAADPDYLVDSATGGDVGLAGRDGRIVIHWRSE